MHREIVFEIYPRNVKEPRWLQHARSQFNATLAAAADLRRQALLMSLHRRCAARQQSSLVGSQKLHPQVPRGSLLCPLCVTGLQRYLRLAVASRWHFTRSLGGPETFAVGGVHLMVYVWPLVQVSCGRVFAGPSTSCTAAHHHDGGHPGRLVHLQRHAVATRPRVASRS